MTQKSWNICMETQLFACLLCMGAVWRCTTFSASCVVTLSACCPWCTCTQKNNANKRAPIFHVIKSLLVKHRTQNECPSRSMLTTRCCVGEAVPRSTCTTNNNTKHRAGASRTASRESHHTSRTSKALPSAAGPLTQLRTCLLAYLCSSVLMYKTCLRSFLLTYSLLI